MAVVNACPIAPGGHAVPMAVVASAGCVTAARFARPMVPVKMMHRSAHLTVNVLEAKCVGMAAACNGIPSKSWPSG